MADDEGDELRTRYVGTAEALADTMEPFVNKVKFITYPEKLSSPVDKQVIVAHGSLLQSLKGLQNNLSFSQANMIEAFKIIGKTKNEVWQLPAVQLEDWTDTVAKRTRA
eukprot:7726242-Heterocapsa_arctica.AAC.1